MREITIISKTIEAGTRAGRGQSVGQTVSVSSGPAIDFAAEFAKEMANWFVRDVEGKGLHPADYGGEAIGLYSNSYMSALGKNPESGGSSTGATTLGGLSNVGSWADQAATADRILVQLAGSSDWTSKPLSEVVGLDTAALAQYLTNNNYAKKSDIPSLEGYATQQWVSTQLGSYVTTSALTTALKSYYTSSEVDDKLKKKVDTAFFAKLLAAIAGDGTEIAVNDMNTAIASIKAKFGLWSESYISALGNNGSGGSGGGGVSYDRLDAWGDYDTGKSGWVLSAGLGYDLYTRVTAIQGAGYATQAWVTGQLGSYATQSWVTSQGYLKTVSLDTISDLHSSWDSLLAAAPSAYVTRWPSFAEVTGKPTTLSGYGITDGVNAVSVTGSGNVVTAASVSGHVLTLTKGITALTSVSLSTISDLHASWDDLLKSAPSAYVTRWPAFSEVTSKPTTLAGYGITDAFTKTDADARYVNVTGDTMSGALTVESTITASGLITSSAGFSTPQYVQIGGGTITWDATNNCFHFSHGLYSDSFVSAKGANASAGGTVAGASALSQLTDVTLGTLAAGQILSYNGTKWTNVAMPSVGATSLAGLTDLNSSWISLLQSAPSAYVTRWPTAAEVGALTQATADGRYAYKGGSNATGTWPISISGNADTLSQHDTRNDAITPQSFNSGLRIDFKSNSSGGLSDGGIFFGSLYYRQYGSSTDWTGGHAHQLGFTDNGNIWHRNGTGTAWNAWRKLIDSSNYTTYTVTKTGGGASGTWPISISGNADTLDGLHSDSFMGFSSDLVSTVTNGISISDLLKKYNLYGKLISTNGWAWANSKNIVLNSSYNIDIQRYSLLDFRMGNLNGAWQQKSVLCLPTYSDSSMIYIVQMNTGETAGAVSTVVKRYADYDTVLASNVASASKWATARTLTLTGAVTGSVSLDGSGNVSMATTYATGNISALDSRYVNVSGDTMSGTLTVSTNGTGAYNQGIRINRTALSNWATLTIGNVGTGTSGTSANTWLIGTPSNSNSLIFNLNNASETVGLCLKGHGNTDMRWNNNTVWHAGNDGSGSGLDADLLDGHHNGDITAIRLDGIYTGNGGTQQPSYFAGRGKGIFLNMMAVPAQYSDVIYIDAYGGKDVPYVNAIAFQKTSAAHGTVYHARAAHNGSAWGAWYPFIDSYNIGSYNAGSATKLQTARTLWGQSFNGTANVSGNMTGVGSISASGTITTSSTVYGKVGIYSDGYVSAKGQNTSSDIRLKTKLRDITLSPKSIARAPSMLFAWKQNGMKDVGSSAQYWKNILPDAVKERDGYLEMAYGNIALVSAISLAKHVMSHEERIRKLEQENARLRRILRQQKINV